MMENFSVHTIDTAPDASRPLLEGAQKTFGFVPNLIGVLAESPAVAEAYLTLSQIFDKSSLNAVERQVAILAVSRYNEWRLLHGGAFGDRVDAKGTGRRDPSGS